MDMTGPLCPLLWSPSVMERKIYTYILPFLSVLITLGQPVSMLLPSVGGCWGKAKFIWCWEGKHSFVEQLSCLLLSLWRETEKRKGGPAVFKRHWWFAWFQSPILLRSHQSWYHFLSLYFIIIWGRKERKTWEINQVNAKVLKKRQVCTSWACLEKESALAIIAAVLSSSSPSFCPLSSSAIRARARSPTTPDAALFMPSMFPGPGMCWARLREAFPAAVSPTTTRETHGMC